MPQKTLDGEDVSEEDFWEEGSFIESVSPEEMKQKERTIHMKPSEEMNYNCKQCSAKISAHNKDWHAGLCDKCFGKMMKKGI
jgi:DNA-directed RNA polymerase subunit RPC12/RpoP